MKGIPSPLSAPSLSPDAMSESTQADPVVDIEPRWHVR